MLICDQYLAIRAIAGDLPEKMRGEHLAIASSHYWLLLRAVAKLRDPHPGVMGRLSRLIAGLSPAAQQQLAAPLPIEQFDSLLEAQILVADWRTDYNTYRPHSALGMLTPAEYADQWANNNQKKLS